MKDVAVREGALDGVVKDEAVKNAAQSSSERRMKTDGDGRAETPPGWAHLLHNGRLGEALRTLLQDPQADPEIVRTLEALEEVRASLRAKAWDRALERTEGLVYPARFGDRDAAGSAPFDSAALATQVKQLGVSGKHLERGEADEALALLSGVTQPLLSAEAETQRGTAHIFLGDAEAAKGAFSRALQSDAKHYRAQTNLGNVALEEGRIDDAIGLYEGALKLNEGFANAHHNLGVAYRRKGQINRSVNAIRRAQRVSRQRDREEARTTLRSLGRGASGRNARWLLYAALAIGAFLLLRAQGVL